LLADTRASNVAKYRKLYEINQIVPRTLSNATFDIQASTYVCMYVSMYIYIFPKFHVIKIVSEPRAPSGNIVVGTFNICKNIVAISTRPFSFKLRVVQERRRKPEEKKKLAIIRAVKSAAGNCMYI